ncbi:MAG: serine/threonine protein kinase [Pseudomonadota bacterium]
MNAADDSATLAYASLQPEDMIAALESVGFRCDGRFLTLNSYENRVYQIGIEDDEPVVAKFYRPQRWSDAAIREEHDFALELEDSDIPVVGPLEINNDTLHQHGDFRFAIYPRRGGRSPDLDRAELLRQIGRFVGRIHNVGAVQPFEHRPTLDAESYGESSRDFLLSNGFIPVHIESVYEGLADEILDYVAHSEARAGDVGLLRIHADFHPSNVLVAGEAVHIVDLDDTRTGPAVQDLWMFLSGEAAEQTPQLAALLAGYTEFRSFNGAELNLIEALRSLRIMHYAAWLARRWADPAFQVAFPWFDSPRYWEEHVLALREQLALMQEPPLTWIEDFR